MLGSLPESQAGAGRHKCAGCAYEDGYADGFNNRNSSFNPEKYPKSQAGTARHKDVKKAYELGYQNGQKDYKGK
ncbi:hypothetical protein JP30_02465 [Gallibacterium anatis IPDH697-78]|nr:hypothetical protein JP30_02465 [Gallibacterium anatis IPDH697-78]